MPSLWTLINETLGELFFAEARLPKTLKALFWPPGSLTKGWWEGRRSPFVSPVRLYLLAAVPFFFLFAYPSDQAGSGRAFFKDMMEEAYMLAMKPPFSPHQAPPAEVAEDSAARAAWRQEYAEERDRDWALYETMVAGVQAGLNRILDLLSIAVGIVMVPLLGFIVGFGMRSREPYVAGVIFSLHLHTVAYLSAALSWVAGAGFGPGFAVGGVYLIAARRHLKGESIPYAAFAAFGIAAGYIVSFIFLSILVVRLLAHLAPGWTFGV